jgi:hypothetical protein
LTRPAPLSVCGSVHRIVDDPRKCGLRSRPFHGESVPVSAVVPVHHSGWCSREMSDDAVACDVCGSPFGASALHGDPPPLGPMRWIAAVIALAMVGAIVVLVAVVVATTWMSSGFQPI